jgi:hypothetical protein
MIDLEQTIAEITEAHRQRVYWMEMRKRQDLALGAALRSRLGWSLDKSPAERNAIREKAAHLIEIGEKYIKARRKAMERATDNPEVEIPKLPPELAPYPTVVPTVMMRAQNGGIDQLEAAQTSEMERLAKKLPVAWFAENTRGLGLLGLAIIVGEAGDLSKYPTKGHLWSRLGLAVHDGIRQGRIPLGLTQEARKAAWIEQRYNPRRRARIFTVGSAIKFATGGPYNQAYRDRKVYLKERAEVEGLIVVPEAKIPKNKDGYISLGHIDNGARRYAEKKMIRDLWNAWRGEATKPLSARTNGPVPGPITTRNGGHDQRATKGHGSLASA